MPLEGTLFSTRLTGTLFSTPLRGVSSVMKSFHCMLIRSRLKALRDKFRHEILSVRHERISTLLNSSKSKTLSNMITDEIDHQRTGQDG